MSEEIFDVVNEDDEVVGQRPRSEVHRLKLLHRATHVLVFNAEGELFLQKRSMSKDCSPGLWDSSAAGHLDSGEDYDACAYRELGEELGLMGGVTLKRLFKLEASPESEYEFAWVYRCESQGPFSLHPEEIDDGQWFDTRTVSDWLARNPEQFASSFRLIWTRMQAQGRI